MNQKFRKALFHTIMLAISISILASCGDGKLPSDLPGAYTGTGEIVARVQKDGQYLFYEDNVTVSLIIDQNQQVTGKVGEASFEGCTVEQNRGWIGRQLHIKTDFLVLGKLTGTTFSRDTLNNKDISIPFNVENGELKGSLFMTNNGEQFPIISFLKLPKR